MTDGADSRPLARAVVTLNGAELRPNRLAVADQVGRFVFAGLPAGSFTVTASKPSYLTMSYGQSAAGKGSGVPISVEPGQQVAGLTLKLPRGSVISGRILDERGQPVRHAPILVMEYRMFNGERTLWSLGSQWPPTDSAGMYRVYGLTPGNYIVSAYPPGDYNYFPGASQGPFIPSGGSTGAELRQVGAAEMQWALQRIRASETAGNRQAALPPAVPEPPPGPAIAYVAAYYPGTSDPAAAVAVTVGRGEERTGVDFTMQRLATARIEGRVVAADGQLATNVRLESTGMGGGTMGWTSADGNFSLPTLLPGQYRITARSADSATWSMSEVTLNAQDVTGLVLTLGPSLTLTGRLAFEATSLPLPSDQSAVRLSLVSVPASPSLLSVRAAADGTFKFPSVNPGRYRMQATLPNPPGPSGSDAGARWSIKSAMVKGHDAADAPFELRPNESVSGVVVTFTDRATELAGTLRDAAGRPAPGYYVVVFSTDKMFWLQGARRLPAPARSATDGKFRFAGLPPGTYLVAALTDMNPSDLYDEAFLTQLSTSAITVTLAEGEKKTQDLRLAGG